VKHSSNGAIHCDNRAIEKLMVSYIETRDSETLSQIVNLAQMRALTLIRFNKTTRYRSEDELLSDINFKLMRSVSKFDPARGSGFTFISHVVRNVLCTSVTNARKQSERRVEMHPSELEELAANYVDETHCDDIKHRIKLLVRTALTDERELETQRWFVESFCADGFESRRHACANAAIGVFGLTHERSREIFDLTMLEVRRNLYSDILRTRTIQPGQLFGTRAAWMTRYAELLNSAEFTKFVTLMRDLAPYLLYLIVDPEKKNSHRKDRNPTISRANIELILNGSIGARLLFVESISQA